MFISDKHTNAVTSNLFQAFSKLGTVPRGEGGGVVHKTAREKIKKAKDYGMDC